MEREGRVEFTHRARAASSAAVSGPRTRSTIASTVRAPWSILKFDQSIWGGVSAASKSIGVRLLANSVSAVSVFVKPGP